MPKDSEQTTTETIALVPARGGSKSIPKKNIKQLGNQPLVAWPIQTAKKTSEINNTYVTTDDDNIASLGREHGASIIQRPPEYATDDSLVIEAIHHAISIITQNKQEPDRVVVLEPTCPFRAVTDVNKCLKRLDQGYDSAATFVEAEVNPHRMWELNDNEPTTFINKADPWQPRQQLPPAYQLNGGCYAFKTEVVNESSGPGLLFGKSAGIKMPPERSIDIDSPLDLSIAKVMIEEGKIQRK
jgi:CMP-N-acetylneuraminic acid synthetase